MIDLSASDCLNYHEKKKRVVKKPRLEKNPDNSIEIWCGKLRSHLSSANTNSCLDPLQATAIGILALLSSMVLVSSVSDAESSLHPYSPAPYHPPAAAPGQLTDFFLQFLSVFRCNISYRGYNKKWQNLIAHHLSPKQHTVGCLNC